MWGALVKLGGALLAGLGVDYAVDSYKEYTAEQKEKALDSKEANWGKYIVIAGALFFGYKLLTRK